MTLSKLIYCMRCKQKTNTKGAHIVAKGNRRFIMGTCAVCGAKKSQAAPKGVKAGKAKKGDGFLSDALSSIGLGMKKKTTVVKTGEGFLSDALSSIGLGMPNEKK